jgi:hypothetical protein
MAEVTLRSLMERAGVEPERVLDAPLGTDTRKDGFELGALIQTVGTTEVTIHLLDTEQFEAGLRARGRRA